MSGARRLSILWWALPLVLVGLLFANTIPLGGKIEQRVSLSVEQGGFARMAEPDVHRFSEVKSLGMLWYRELMEPQVSFFLEDPHLATRGDGAIELRVWFRSSVPMGDRVLAWAEGAEGYVPRVLFERNAISGVSWSLGRATWTLSELRIRGTKVQFFLQVPHLEGEDRSEFWLPVGWIDVAVVVPGPLSYWLVTGAVYVNALFGMALMVPLLWVGHAMFRRLRRRP